MGEKNLADSVLGVGSLKRASGLSKVTDYWFKVLEDSWVIFKIEMEELFRE